jgi:hypothetical protein
MDKHSVRLGERGWSDELWSDDSGESDEDRRVLRWRLEQAIGLGFALAPAALLASSPADLNSLRRLMALGCPHDTAVAILL